MSLALKHDCTFQNAMNEKLLIANLKERSTFLTLWTKALDN